MSGIKSLFFFLAFFSSLSHVSAAEYDFIPFSEEHSPCATIKWSYRKTEHFQIPADLTREDSNLLLLQNAQIITTDPIDREVILKVTPSGKQTLVIPTGFSLEVNEMVLAFLQYHSPAKRFLEEHSRFAQLTGNMENTLTITDKNGIVRSIGTQKLTSLQTPLQFLESLERNTQRLTTQVLLLTCQHNPQLMAVMGRTLDGQPHEDINLHNMLGLGKLLATSPSVVCKETETGFILVNGDVRVTLNQEDPSSLLQQRMAQFITDTVNPEMLEKRLHPLILSALKKPEEGGGAPKMTLLRTPADAVEQHTNPVKTTSTAGPPAVATQRPASPPVETTSITDSTAVATQQPATPPVETTSTTDATAASPAEHLAEQLRQLEKSTPPTHNPFCAIQ